MNRKLLEVALFTNIALCLFLPQKANSQSISANRPKPQIKGGKFIFYNPAFRKDTLTLFNKKNTLAPTCACAASSAAKQKHFVVTGGQMVLYLTTTDATCGYGSGSIIVQVANGTAPYTFTFTDQYGFSTIQATGNFPVAGAGTYTILVTDATGATATATVTLKNISPGPVLALPSFQVSSNCFDANAEITMNATGGTPPYSYSLDLINLRMSDDERLHAIDGIYADTKDKYLFLRQFNNSTTILAVQRATDLNDVQTIQNLYGLQ